MSFQLNCISCGAPIAADDVNLQNLVAKCRQCNAIFSFQPPNTSSYSEDQPLEYKDPLPYFEKSDIIDSPSDGQQVKMPKGVIVERDFGELRFLIPWKDTRRWGFFLLFTIVWNAILIPFVVIGVTTGIWQILLFGSIHIIIGVSFLLYTLGCLLNKTRIVVTTQGIDIKNGPIPVPFNPNKFMSVMDVEQLFVEEYVPSKTNGRPDYTYAVTALTKGQERIRLVGGFSQPGYALYLEQEIEKFLGIKNKPIR